MQTSRIAHRPLQHLLNRHHWHSRHVQSMRAALSACELHIALQTSWFQCGAGLMDMAMQAGHEGQGVVAVVVTSYRTASHTCGLTSKKAARYTQLYHAKAHMPQWNDRHIMPSVRWLKAL